MNPDCSLHLRLASYTAREHIQPSHFFLFLGRKNKISLEYSHSRLFTYCYRTALRNVTHKAKNIYCLACYQKKKYAISCSVPKRGSLRAPWCAACSLPLDRMPRELLRKPARDAEAGPPPAREKPGWALTPTGPRLRNCTSPTPISAQL